MPKYISKMSIIFLLMLCGGFLLANNILIIVSVIPLCVLAFGYYLKTSNDVIVKKTISKNRAAVDEEFEVNLKIWINSGIGPIEICDLVPAHFELVSGSNYCVLWKGFEPLEHCLSYTIKCTTSGTYLLKTTLWKSRHIVCNYCIDGMYTNDLSVEVTPRLLQLKKVRGMTAVSSVPLPEGALASMGMTTHEFKEIRQYYFGDPFKSINWKATSRNLLRGNIWPVVNEFEKEGKKTVWVFLDTSRIMAFGSNIKNVKEYSIEAVYSLSEFYLGHSCSVAFHTYGGNNVFIKQGSGKQQLYKILRELMKIKYSGPAVLSPRVKIKNLEESVFSCREFFVGLRPLFIIVTRFCTNNYNEILKGINTMSKYTMLRKGYLPSIMVVNIMGYGLMAENQYEKMASNVLEAMNRVISTDVRKNCIWIDWDPAKESLTGALLKQVVAAK
jgi:uncharacterized protein (DUF58 family)